VIASALEHQPCTAILDDAAARAAARIFGVRTLGTIGILVRARAVSANL
jgi:predicted nucleic acid-binding protein